MSRKGNYLIDYDDDYDYYDNGYDDDFEDGNESYRHEVLMSPGSWQCAICTYHNDEKLTSCDVCGVIRDSTIKSLSKADEEAVDEFCKSLRASKLAKSLFPELPARKSKTGVMFQPIDSLSKGVDNSHGVGMTRGKFSDFQEALVNSNARYRFNIARFKFDSSSPDDLVSAAKSSGKNTKVISQGASSKALLGASNKQGILEFSPNASKDGTSSKSSAEAARCKVHEEKTDDKRFTSNSSSFLEEDQPPSPASSLRSLNLNVTSDSKKIAAKTRKAVPLDAYTPETWMFPDQKEEGLSHLNVAIVGHVDSGKSTLSGRLLHIRGRISQKDMHKYEKEARQQGKASLSYAWALDESVEERERGITMTVAIAHFDSKKFHIVLLDSPGHKDFVSNMISGATQADAAILVVDASIGSFESGMGLNGGGGQTKEHAQLIRSFGIDQLIVAVNKMDIVGYSKERFIFIKAQLGDFLRTCGFKESLVSWVALSAMENQGLVEASTEPRLSWYKGLHLLDAIDTLQPPEREILKPLRLPICDVLKSRSLGQAAVSGKVEAGALRSGARVLIMPSGGIVTVKGIERDSQACSIARAGDNVDVGLQGDDGISLMKGGVLCHPDFPTAMASRLELKVLVLETKMPIVVGSQVEFHIHHAKEAARINKIIGLLDPKSGMISKKPLRCLTSKQRAMIEVILCKELCVEEFSNYRALGRAFLRASGQTIAVGIVIRILD